MLSGKIEVSQFNITSDGVRDSKKRIDTEWTGKSTWWSGECTAREALTGPGNQHGGQESARLTALTGPGNQHGGQESARLTGGTEINMVVRRVHG